MPFDPEGDPRDLDDVVSELGMVVRAVNNVHTVEQEILDEVRGIWPMLSVVLVLLAVAVAHFWHC